MSVAEDYVEYAAREDSGTHGNTLSERHYDADPLEAPDEPPDDRPTKMLH